MKKEQPPPRDSWIRLAPDKAVTLDERLSKLWSQKTWEWREVRGNVLSACFEIEYLVDNVLCEILFPRIDRAPAEKRVNNERIETYADVTNVRQLFDGLFLKSGVISFNRKIDILRNLLAEMRTLQDLVSSEIDYRAFSGTQHPFRHTNPGGQSEFTEHAKFGSACSNRFTSLLLWNNTTPIPTQMSRGTQQPMSRANTQLRTRFTRYPLSKLIWFNRAN